jgi:hypothetical protein
MNVKQNIEAVQGALLLISAKHSTREIQRYNISNQEYNQRSAIMAGFFIKDRIMVAILEDLEKDPKLPLLTVSFFEEFKQRFEKAMAEANLYAEERHKDN